MIFLDMMSKKQQKKKNQYTTSNSRASVWQNKQKKNTQKIQNGRKFLQLYIG